ELPLFQCGIPARLRGLNPPRWKGWLMGRASSVDNFLMRARLAAILSFVVLLGCFGEARLPYQSIPVSYANPSLLRIANHELVWDGVVDVVSQYFRVEREDPVRLLGSTLTVGRI